MTTTRTPPAAATLAALFAITGAIHFVRPGVFDPIVPRSLPGSSRSWTYGSGAAEWVLAAILVHPRTRSIGGLLSAMFLLAVFPANVRTVRVLRRKPLATRLVALARLPLQAPLIALALRVGRDEAS